MSCAAGAGRRAPATGSGCRCAPRSSGSRRSATAERHRVGRRAAPGATREHGGRLGGLSFDGLELRPQVRLMVELVAQLVDACPDGEQHRPHRVVQLQGKPAPLLVHRDLGAVAGGARRRRRRWPLGRPRSRAPDGHIAVARLGAVGAVEDPEPATGVHQRHRDHPLDALPLGLGAEGPDEAGADRVVGHPLGPPGLHDPPGQPDPRWHDEAVDDVGAHPDRVAQLDAADPSSSPIQATSMPASSGRRSRIDRNAVRRSSRLRTWA